MPARSLSRRNRFLTGAVLIFAPLRGESRDEYHEAAFWDSLAGASGWLEYGDRLDSRCVAKTACGIIALQ